MARTEIQTDNRYFSRTEKTTDTWITPRYIIDALGPFDIDPCAAPKMPWPTAKKMISLPDDGLKADWEGFVWLNPPYGREQGAWIKKLAAHRGCGIALIPARTDTALWHEVIFPLASVIFFVRGRISFCGMDGKPRVGNNSPSAIIGFGDNSKMRFCGLLEMEGKVFFQ
ncbi:MAG: adenine methyltransferase [Patescibacteria group bacterium]|nr:adenine methyltransferase [Patescibacteria group bacterium]